MNLANSRLKIKRANHHIAELNDRIFLLKNSDTATVEIDPSSGNEVIKHDLTDRNALTDIALIFGDVIHNLKCAIDYAWLQTIERLVPSAVGNFAKFPIYETADQLHAALNGRKIEAASPELFKLITTQIKPYKGGDFAIWSIHKLDIRDKHRLLIPLAYYSSVEGIETQDERGEVQKPAGTWGTEQVPPWYIPMPLGYHVTNNGKVSIDVIFYDRALTDHMVDAETLLMYSNSIIQIVEIFERFLEPD